MIMIYYNIKHVIKINLPGLFTRDLDDITIIIIYKI